MNTLTKKSNRITAVRGMGSALIAFAGWVVLYIVFGMINPQVLTLGNMLNLLRSMAK